jgi:serine/threonine protein kinase
MHRLSGYPPFYADSAPALFKNIMYARYDFDDPVWGGISDSAKDLIRHLLVKDPSKRFTAAQCLEHAWLRGAAPLSLPLSFLRSLFLMTWA